MKSGNAPTMKDVAKEAGVSLGTVSKVINGIPVGDHYRKRVEAATKKLGYQVNNYARGLKTNKSNCVALIMPSLRHPFFAALTDALSMSLMRSGYRSVLMITNFDSVVERNSFTLAHQNKIDGIIALTYTPNLPVDESVPVVTIDRHFSPTTPCVSSDNYRGGEIAAETLIALGCRNLLYLRTSSPLYSEVSKRGSGFEHACHLAGVPAHCAAMETHESLDTLYEFLNAHIHNGRLEYDGIFCHSDFLALRTREFLEQRNIHVPEDVQLIGYDGVADFFTGRYPCSSIVQPINDMADAAVRLLLDGEEPLSAANISLPVHFVPGGTTLPAVPADNGETLG